MEEEFTGLPCNEVSSVILEISSLFLFIVHNFFNYLFLSKAVISLHSI